MINHEKPSQDGYRVLYAFLTCCHPKLVQRTKLDTPKLAENGNLFTFMRNYKNWLEYEKISNRHYSDVENLTVVMNVLENDGRFSKALSAISMQKQLYEQMILIQLGTQFPLALTIENIPYTIMNEYATDEKRDLFGNENNDTNAVINKLNDRPVQNPYRRNKNNRPRFQLPAVSLQRRERLDKVCKGCGSFGHMFSKTDVISWVTSLELKDLWRATQT